MTFIIFKSDNLSDFDSSTKSKPNGVSDFGMMDVIVKMLPLQSTWHFHGKVPRALSQHARAMTLIVSKSDNPSDFDLSAKSNPDGVSGFSMMDIVVKMLPSPSTWHSCDKAPHDHSEPTRTMTFIVSKSDNPSEFDSSTKSKPDGVSGFSMLDIVVKMLPS